LAKTAEIHRRVTSLERNREAIMKRLCLFAVLLFIAGPVYGQGSSQGSSPASSVWIDDLTWPEVQDAIAAGKRTAIIYAGSSEQNGPHMVIGKHNFIARALAQRIAEELGDALVYPVLPYAITGNAVTRTGHMRFPGSVSLPPEAFFGVVRGVAQSALTAGFKVVALMGDHGGGQDELALAAKELDGEVRASGARVLFIGDLYAKSRVQMRDILAKRGLPTDEDHAGIPDTSSLLYLETQGQWVRKDKIALADPKNGVRGHPQHASAELGKVYLDLKVDLAVKQVRSLLAASK
jgi:creatinine amidohydrolase/Fe(II)-dependent formamide hydrolase-like protein